MKDDAKPTKRHRGQRNVHKLLTPEMRQDIEALKEQMEGCACHLTDLYSYLEDINDAILKVQEIAECLLDDDPFGAWDVIKRDRPAEATEAEGDWDTEDPDWLVRRQNNSSTTAHREDIDDSIRGLKRPTAPRIRIRHQTREAEERWPSTGYRGCGTARPDSLAWMIIASAAARSRN